tara:strand:- start:471 stop:698 length:228 start_codon:yes stop_codon:yes gene_type:complete
LQLVSVGNLVADVAVGPTAYGLVRRSSGTPHATAFAALFVVVASGMPTLLRTTIDALRTVSGIREREALSFAKSD